MAKRRKKQSDMDLIKWQTKDQGANPLTDKGKTWIDKEINKFKENESEERAALENQEFDEGDSETSPYWNWIERQGFEGETAQANPDILLAPDEDPLLNQED